MAATRFPTNTPSADDLGAPSDFGSTAPAPRSASRLPVEEDTPTAAGVVAPEHVHYHDDEHRCDLCTNFGRANQCAVLQMPVSPEGACNAYSARDGGDEDQDEDDDINPAATRFEDEDADYDYDKENPRGAYGA